jgi:hypothetical protein
MATIVAATPTLVPGLLLRPDRWPEETRLIADIDATSRLAAGSRLVVSREMLRSFYDHLAGSDLAADLRLAEVDGRPVCDVRVPWTDEDRVGRVHSAALFVTPDAPPGSFAARLDRILARHLHVGRATGAEA